MKISGWNRYPVIDTTPVCAFSHTQLQGLVTHGFKGIARGMGRSYGDSSLADSVIDLTTLDYLLDFDHMTGRLRCCAGVTLNDLLNIIVSRGWFMPVTPGTKYVTVGGAIASDVHGKNHHLSGSFSDYVLNFKLLIADGSIVTCSRDDNADLFYATCGGMGLTGIILEADLRLLSINSAYIHKTTYKAASLMELLELFSIHHEATYSVAWMDCLRKGKSLGRSLLMLGEHADIDKQYISKPVSISIPFDMPGSLLNPLSISFFNWLYYSLAPVNPDSKLVHLDSFFYPLDVLGEWHRLYGKRGFLQYQFVIPMAAGLEAIAAILGRIADSQLGSFLAVLKLFGKGNRNLLSFPMEGYTLALDFKIGRNTFELLDRLDDMVVDYGGKVYLTKDSRMSEKIFKRGYPLWEDFSAIRQKYGALEVFNSHQSGRLGL